ncbi:hypothetical protein JOD02_001767 [Caldicoprobacter guelmensis]|uniref:hypothetical protein n=1 Tax=Caldicoprobacter guelmensis TaxID=1170224 RepID=UPI0019587FDC|nr:hypothetical protein [Caldicoprobacter guelmensis]MBM7582898.1 hypothetical protein [Caldicoprobacter guelmensis]
MAPLHDEVTSLIISRDEVERLDYSAVDSFIKQAEEKEDVLKSKLILNFEGYPESLEEIYKVPSIRKWVKGLIDRHPYIFYFLASDGGLNTLLVVACIGDFQEIDSLTSEEVTEGLLHYETVNYNNKWFKVSLPKDVSNKIIEGLIEYGLKMNLESDDVLFTILSIPGLNAG